MMDTKQAIFWSNFADNYDSDELAARAIRDMVPRVEIKDARATIRDARAHLADPLFNRPVAREIIRDILDKSQKIDN